MRQRCQRGYATVWAAGWMAVCLSVTWLVLLLVVAVARQHHLDGAADLVSLSAAAAQQRGRDPCTTAADIAAANAVRLVDCSVRGVDVVVRVGDTVRLPIGITLGLTSSARAGPD